MKRCGATVRRGAAAALLVVTPGAALAGPADYMPSLTWIDPRSAIGLAIVTGIVIFATTLSILHVLQRRRWTDQERILLGQIARLRAEADRSAFLAGTDRQVVVAWDGRDEGPVVAGDATALLGTPDGAGVTSFGRWLLPPDAARIDGLVDRLRSRGESFVTTLATVDGRFAEADGRAHAGHAILRLRAVDGSREAVLRAESERGASEDALTALHTLLDAGDLPVWLRSPDGRLSFANRAYADCVDATGADEAVARGLEILPAAERAESQRVRQAGDLFHARTAAIVRGTRRVLDIVEAPLPGGAGGVARDVSDLESVRADLQRQMQAHVATLDGLSTAVAMFDVGQRLVFHNAAYRQLWALDTAYLETHPTDGEILDRLRSARRLPEQADYREWKAGLLAGYRTGAPTELWWHLPDRRTLRVIARPTPQGGLTYLFDDESDSIHLESRYNSLISVQRDTLDTLAEGVALFGTNGRLRLYNRAFADLWRLDREALDAEPHVEAVVALCRSLAPDEGAWTALRGAVFGFSDIRERTSARIARIDGSTLDCAAEPLPDGGTLLTFVDVTASVNVERALTERNDALERAGRVRNEFVHHVSYELRSPLTNIIGFAELLGAGTVGPLSAKQREYTDHITRSSGALLAIINDILDLASIDTETIDLALERIDIIDTIGEAARGIADRLAEAEINLVVDVPSDIGSFTADGRRVRQILFNLLSNASGFSISGQTIRVAARRQADEVVISVIDQGSGIPETVRSRVFDRFESHTAGSRHRGVGLGLSIVRSFVELHGGHVELVSEPGRGTTVSCFFPADGRPAHRLAAE